jgi:hypothetical protein
MAAVVDQPVSAAPPTRHTRRALSAGLTRLQKRGLKALGYIVLVYLLFRLLPALKQALHSLEHVRWEWIVGAVALELLSELGYVQSWRAIVDRDGLLAADGRGTRTATRAAWAQLGGGMLVPGGSLASIGVGAWILRHFGMPARTIADRQFNLGFLNTAVDALALVLFGVGLAVGTRSWPHRSAPSRGQSTPPTGSCFTAATGEACSARSRIWGSTRSCCGPRSSRFTPTRYRGSRRL